jgi:acyl dehydratase
VGPDLVYEDVEIGAEIETPAHIVSEADIMGFAEITRDRHPLHTDPDYCRGTPFGRPIAHGLLGLSLMEGLKSELRLYQHTSIASLGWDKVRFLKPVFAGDRVRAEVRFASKRPSRRPDRGVVVETVRLVNQEDEVVIDAEHATLLWRRGHVPGEAGA